MRLKLPARARRLFASNFDKASLWRLCSAPEKTGRAASPEFDPFVFQGEKKLCVLTPGGG